VPQGNGNSDDTWEDCGKREESGEKFRQIVSNRYLEMYLDVLIGPEGMQAPALHLSAPFYSQFEL
jgi:hypothetical protein